MDAIRIDATAGLHTIRVSEPHGLSENDLVTLAGFLPEVINNVGVEVLSVLSPDTFTFACEDDCRVMLALGTVTQ